MKNTKNEPVINPSTIKSRRRYQVLDAVARRILNDPKAAWSNVGTSFTGSIFPVNVKKEALIENEVRKQIIHILEGMLSNLNSLPPTTSTKPASDLINILISHPRQKRGKRSEP